MTDSEQFWINMLLGMVVLFLSFLVVVLGFAAIDTLTGLSCNQKYDNSEYSLRGGCKVEYNGKYIPEDLYEKAFTQNISIENKK